MGKRWKKKKRIENICNQIRTALVEGSKWKRVESNNKNNLGKTYVFIESGLALSIKSVDSVDEIGPANSFWKLS